MRRQLDSEATRFILVRHAQTQWNSEGRYQGQQDSPLTREGAAQAEAVAGRLRNVRVDALYASDLGRCLATAGYIERAVGLSVRTDARLRERNHGVFEGLTSVEARQRYPEVYQQHKSETGADYILPGGESRRQVLARALAAMQELAERHPRQQVAVVGHTGFLYIYLNHLLGAPMDSRNAFVIRNCSISVVSAWAARWQVETLGDVCHLGIFA